MSNPLPNDSQLQQYAARLGEQLRRNHDRVVTAESCSGGWVAKALTDVNGSSDWFDCGMVVYSYEAKQAMLGVSAHTLQQHGAVSRETAVEMVAGALAHSGASVAVAVTGIAGPSGGSADKPVGMVWIAWKRRGGYPRADCFYFQGEREAIRRQAVLAALHGLENI